MAPGPDTRKKPRYMEVNGIRFDNCFIPNRIISAMNYEPEKGDVFVATYPKCGTTWMCHIVLMILRRGDEPLTPDDYFSCCPFMEMHGAEFVRNRSKPGCIKTHLPFDRIRFSKDAKYVYVARHPRDCVVSFYHHTKLFPNYYFTNGTFDDFFEVFIRGETDFNDYFDNLLSWYEHRNKENVFFTTFERMKQDHRGTVLDVAKFLGPEHYEAIVANNGKLLEDVMRLTGFEHMKHVTDRVFLDAFLKVPDDLSSLDEDMRHSWQNMAKAIEEGQVSVGSFVRKGESGEGKAVLSEEQSRRLKARIDEKTRGSDVMSLWENSTR